MLSYAGGLLSFCHRVPKSQTHRTRSIRSWCYRVWLSQATAGYNLLLSLGQNVLNVQPLHPERQELKDKATNYLFTKPWKGNINKNGLRTNSVRDDLSKKMNNPPPKTNKQTRKQTMKWPWLGTQELCQTMGFSNAPLESLMSSWGQEALLQSHKVWSLDLSAAGSRAKGRRKRFRSQERRWMRLWEGCMCFGRACEKDLCQETCWRSQVREGRQPDGTRAWLVATTLLLTLASRSVGEWQNWVFLAHGSVL